MTNEKKQKSTIERPNYFDQKIKEQIDLRDELIKYQKYLHKHGYAGLSEDEIDEYLSKRNLIKENN